MSLLLAEIGITFLIALLIQIIQFKFTDRVYVKENKKQVEKLRKRMKKLKLDSPERLKIQSKLLQMQTDLMKHCLMPTLITWIPILVVFSWFRSYFSEVQFTIPFINFTVGWLGTYIIFSIIFSIIIRWVFNKIEMRA